MENFTISAEKLEEQLNSLFNLTQQQTILESAYNEINKLVHSPLYIEGEYKSLTEIRDKISILREDYTKKQRQILRLKTFDEG